MGQPETEGKRQSTKWGGRKSEMKAKGSKQNLSSRLEHILFGLIFNLSPWWRGWWPSKQKHIHRVPMLNRNTRWWVSPKPITGGEVEDWIPHHNLGDSLDIKLEHINDLNNTGGKLSEEREERKRPQQQAGQQLRLSTAELPVIYRGHKEWLSYFPNSESGRVSDYLTWSAILLLLPSSSFFSSSSANPSVIITCYRRHRRPFVIDSFIFVIDFVIYPIVLYLSRSWVLR